jgi:hypothetical protein
VTLIAIGLLTYGFLLFAEPSQKKSSGLTIKGQKLPIYSCEDSVGFPPTSQSLKKKRYIATD